MSGSGPGLAVVTGGAGFVGAALCRHLLDRGFRVRVLARSTSSRARLQNAPVEWAEGDVTLPATLVRAFEGAAAVFHVAGLVSYRSRDRAAMEAVNVGGTANVLAAARAAGVPRLVHTSSVVAVGSSPRPAVLDEDAPWRPPRGLAHPGSYFDTKRRGEDLVREAAARGAHAVIVNPAAVLGAGDARGNLHQLLRMILRRNAAVVPPGGVNGVDVRDVAAGHLLALERGRPGERYILGHENVTFTDFALRLAFALEREPWVLRLPRPAVALLRGLARAIDPWRPLAPPFTPDTTMAMGRWFWFHSGKAARELGYAPRPIDEALRAAAELLVRGPRTIAAEGITA